MCVSRLDRVFRANCGALGTVRLVTYISAINFIEHLRTLSFLIRLGLGDIPKQIRVRWSKEPLEVQNLMSLAVQVSIHLFPLPLSRIYRASYLIT